MNGILSTSQVARSQPYSWLYVQCLAHRVVENRAYAGYTIAVIRRTNTGEGGSVDHGLRELMEMAKHPVAWLDGQ